MKSVIIERGHGLISRRQREGAQRFDPVQFVQSKVLGEKKTLIIAAALGGKFHHEVKINLASVCEQKLFSDKLQKKKKSLSPQQL